jgi:DNA-directed RNA polymerase subunit beta'
MANTAAEEHAAELEQGPEAAVFSDPLAVVEGETHGTDADAGEYLAQSDEDLGDQDLGNEDVGDEDLSDEALEVADESEEPEDADLADEDETPEEG